MTASEKELETVIPDLRDIPLDRLAELGDSALGQSIARYRRRLKENEVPLSSFTARI
jgi:FXSXX-COOH protein